MIDDPVVRAVLVLLVVVAVTAAAALMARQLRVIVPDEVFTPTALAFAGVATAVFVLVIALVVGLNAVGSSIRLLSTK